jgi:hypothetical protein
MAIEKLVPQYLNKDEDERLVKPFEMTDALNIRVSHEDDGDQGIIKNVEGNTVIAPRTTADTIPSSGSNRIIGSIGSDAGRCIYYFLFNSSGNHGIYKYSTVNDTYEKVYESSVLGFSGDAFVKADIVFDKNGDHLLYFTDDINEPRKINATRALAGGYNSNINSATASIADKYLTTCKQPPQTPITFEFQSIESLEQNHLKENIFQFAYQYVYDDGEVSALSAYSRLAVSSTHFAFNAPQRNAGTTSDNQLRLTLTSSDGPVDKIRVFARRNNEPTFFRVDEIDNIVGTGTQTIEFRNDKVFPILSNEESAKLFDAVPRQARAQAFTNNRLVFGNYLEGFDNLEDTDVYGYPVYAGRSNVQFADSVISHNPLDFATTAPSSAGGVPNSSFISRAFTEQASAGGGVLAFPHDGVLGWSFILNVDELQPEDEYYKDVEGTNAGVSAFGVEEGTVVSLNLSEFENTDFSGDVSYRFGFSVNAEEVSISARHPSNILNGSLSDSFTVEVRTADSNGDLTISNDIRLLNPVAKDIQTSTTSRVGVTSENGGPGFIRNLIPGTGFDFDVEDTAISVGTLASFAQNLGEAFLGETAVVSVDSPTPFHRCSRFYEKDTSVTGGGTPPNEIRIAFGGFLKFAITNFWYLPDTQELKLSIEMIDVNLEATRAKCAGVFAPYFDYNDNGSPQQGQILEDNQVQCAINPDVLNANGLAVRDTMTSSYMIGHAIRGAAVKDSFAEVGSTRGFRTFKAGASHDFGIVYFDHRNRAGGVQKTNTINVRHFGHPHRSGRNGRATVDLRIMHPAPSWAVKWAPVYSLNTSYDRFIQATVAEACLPRAATFDDILAPLDSSNADQLRNIEAGGVAQADEAIFLSFRGLEGKPNSYKDGKGAILDYTYREGDILRVLQHDSPAGGEVRPMAEFRVLGYKYFVDDEKNPIKLSDGSNGSTAEVKQRDAYRRTGHFLIIQDNDIPGFSRTDILQGSDFFSQGCLVEIVSPKKEVEDKLFYEVGEQRDVVLEGGEYLHQGDRSLTTSPSFSISPVSNTQFTSSEKLFNGDRVLKAVATTSGHFFIEGTSENADGTYFYTIHNSNPFVDGVVGTTVTAVTIDSDSLTHGVITLDEGDAFFKSREQLVNKREEYNPASAPGTTLFRNPTKPQDQSYEKFAVEADSVSDFFESKCYDIGRAHIETPEQQQIKRISSVTYSEPFVLDSSRLNLSSFNPSLFPFKDYTPQKGSIQYLDDMSESMLIMQEKGCALVPISRTLIQSASDGQLVTAQEVLGKEVYFAGDYGVSRNPESVVRRFGKVFFCDLESGKVVELSQGAIQTISDNKMESHFENRFANYLNTGALVQLPCGIDPENDEYIVTTLTATPVQIQVGDANSQFEGLKPTHPVITTADFSVHVSPSDGGHITWEEEVLKWDYSGFGDNVFHTQWQSAGKGVVILDNIKGNDACFVDRADITSGENFVIDVKSKDNRFRGRALFSPKDGSCDLCTIMLDSDSSNDGSGTDANDTVTVTNLTAVSGDTLAYSTDKSFWLTFYSFVPERYQYVHNRFFSFNDGLMYRHNVNATRNNFYGNQFNSTIDVVSKQSPSMVKAYTAMSLEGNDTWSGTVENTTQTTNITEAMFEEKEGMYYTNIPRGIAANASDSVGTERVVLGVVASQANSNKEITFTSRISNLPFGIGDQVKAITGSGEAATNKSIESIKDRKTIVVDADPGNLVGSTLMALSSDVINGEVLRDYYAKFKLVNDNTSSIELYGVNAVYTPSPLDNSQNQ